MSISTEEKDRYGALMNKKEVIFILKLLSERLFFPVHIRYAHDGFGCSPHAIGRSVRCTCLSDGEMTRWNRDEFVGVLDEKFLPDWAKESLSQFQQEEAAESPGMNNQSM